MLVTVEQQGNGMSAWINRFGGKLWLLAVYIFLYMPLAFMVVFSFNSTKQDANFTGFSLRWYEALLRDSKLVDGFFLSVKIALTTGVLSAVLGTFAAFVLVRYTRFKGRTFFSGMANAPLVMPEVIIGLSLLLLMVGAQTWLGWPERGMLTIVMGHTLLGMAYAMVVIQSRLQETAMNPKAFPLAHTCFFQLDIPNYATDELMNQRLSGAAQLCGEMDTDNNATEDLD